MSAPFTFFAFFLTLVVLLSLVREIKRFDFIWNRFPTLMLFIPTWSFFAPIPNMFDYHLVFRRVGKNNQFYEWVPVFKIPDKRPWYAFLWNPEKRFLKGFLDVVQDLVTFAKKVKDSRQVCTSVPYLLILNYLDSLNHDQNTEKIQFMVLGNSRLYDHEVVFTSEMHPIVKE